MQLVEAPVCLLATNCFFMLRTIILTLAIIQQTFAQGLLDRAQELLTAGKDSEARALLSTVKKGSSEYAGSRYWLGRISFDRNELEEAEELFEEAVELNPSVADYHLWLGNTYGTIAQDANLFRQGLLAPKMREAWETTLKLNPSSLEARSSLIQFYLQAPSMLGGSVDKAMEMAKEIARLDPVQGHRELGDIYLHEKNFAKAETEYLAMYQLDEKNVLPLVNLYTAQKKFDNALELLKKGIAKQPDNYSLRYSFGRTSAISGLQLSLGEECMTKYMSSYTPKPGEPSHAAARMRLGQIYEKQGKRTEARSMFEQAWKQDNSLKEAKEGLARLSK